MTTIMDGPFAHSCKNPLARMNTTSPTLIGAITWRPGQIAYGMCYTFCGSKASCNLFHDVTGGSKGSTPMVPSCHGNRLSQIQIVCRMVLLLLCRKSPGAGPTTSNRSVGHMINCYVYGLITKNRHRFCTYATYGPSEMHQTWSYAIS